MITSCILAQSPDSYIATQILVSQVGPTLQPFSVTSVMIRVQPSRTAHQIVSYQTLFYILWIHAVGRK